MQQAKLLVSTLFLISLIIITACNRKLTPPTKPANPETPHSVKLPPTTFGPKEIAPCDPAVSISVADASDGYRINVPNTPNTIFEDLLKQTSDSVQLLHKDELAPVIQNYMVEGLELVNTVDVSKLTPIMPSQYCRYPLGGSIFGMPTEVDSAVHALFKRLMFMKGEMQVVERIEVETIKAKVRKESVNEEGYHQHIQTHFYLGSFYKLPTYKNRYLLKAYGVATFDPEFQWMLEEYTFVLDYQDNGYLDQMLMEVKVIDRYILEEDLENPRELYWLQSVYNEEKDYIRSFKMREWYFEPIDKLYYTENARLRFYTDGWHYRKRLND